MIDPQKRQRVVELLRDGMTHREIRKETGVGLATISRIRNTSYEIFPDEKKKLTRDIEKEINNMSKPQLKIVGERRILVIGDPHSPFIRADFLPYCIGLYKEYKCNMAICTGDITDSHASSYHESDPDGMSAGDELSAAIEQLKPWHKAFPNLKVCIGNHDRVVMRKAFTGGLSKRWIKDYADVLECPGWEFKHNFIIDDVLYVHGDGSNVKAKMMNNRMSCVGGHKHSECYVVWSVSNHDRLFAMQIGCGFDEESYAAAYGKDLKRGIVSCGVVLKNGTLPIPLPMPL